MLDLRNTPVIRPNVAKHFFAALFVTAFMTLIGYGALYSANEGYRKHALITQEDIAWKR